MNYFNPLPYDQDGTDRHRCTACAYENGYARKEIINLDLDSLLISPAGTVRNNSPHTAYALGYLHGVDNSYKNRNSKNLASHICKYERRDFLFREESRLWIVTVRKASLMPIVSSRIEKI